MIWFGHLAWHVEVGKRKIVEKKTGNITWTDSRHDSETCHLGQFFDANNGAFGSEFWKSRKSLSRIYRVLKTWRSFVVLETSITHKKHLLNKVINFILNSSARIGKLFSKDRSGSITYLFGIRGYFPPMRMAFNNSWIKIEVYS